MWIIWMSVRLFMVFSAISPFSVSSFIHMGTKYKANTRIPWVQISVAFWAHQKSSPTQYNKYREEMILLKLHHTVSTTLLPCQKKIYKLPCSETKSFDWYIILSHVDTLSRKEYMFKTNFMNMICLHFVYY